MNDNAAPHRMFLGLNALLAVEKDGLSASEADAARFRM
jgi:hypothetical protein